MIVGRSHVAKTKCCPLLEKQLKEGQAQWAAASLVNKSNMDKAEKDKLIQKIDQYIKEIDASIKNLNP